MQIFYHLRDGKGPSFKYLRRTKQQDFLEAYFRRENVGNTDKIVQALLDRNSIAHNESLV
jgi:hypothetical protein